MKPPHDDLIPMVSEARSKGLWFFCSYQDLWFSPDELEAEWAKRKFQWSAVNWHLRDPKEKLERLDRDLASLIDERADLSRRMLGR